jgi:hypothetical protein
MAKEANKEHNKTRTAFARKPATKETTTMTKGIEA